MATNSDDGRTWCGRNCASLTWAICCCICLCAGLIVLSIGIVNLESGDDYDNYGTIENCTVIARTQSDRCDACDGNDDKYCNGREYEYSVISLTKCDNDTILLSEHEYCQQDGSSNIKDIGETETCYIIDCEQGLFTFEDSQGRINDTKSIIVIGALWVGITALCILCSCPCTMRYCDKFCNGEDTESDNDFGTSQRHDGIGMNL